MDELSIEGLERLDKNVVITNNIAKIANITEPTENQYSFIRKDKVLMRGYGSEKEGVVITHCDPDKEVIDFLELLKNLSELERLWDDFDKRQSDVLIVVYKNGDIPRVNGLEVDPEKVDDEYNNLHIVLYAEDDETETYAFHDKSEKYEFTKGVYEYNLAKIKV